ncbi:hypothetical protein HDG40_003455 [Paraburkholderia sp. JPY158]|uniref:Uncharacterized protein n=1 Tax=Paraburkholderia atlantica TaxID=2654982 RepID=A0A7W8Q8X7_PARAM|nr:hypothetical protein [Paraburkholderia atlantica]
MAARLQPIWRYLQGITGPRANKVPASRPGPRLFERADAVDGLFDPFDGNDL